ncbi:hypothetical protein PFLUV_G00255280 [Perca fluviatilis]|uniref:Uncharacterized protein n=1 Tax=Perca fluviatilis TaxID=8168 RepID=A0A6A5DYZ9_PERFL|nr:hypothetical protein PFLUV_G00255280 [Perca fluviatilis]
MEVKSLLGQRQPLWLHTKNGREVSLEREPRDSCFFSSSDLSAQFTVCERQRAYQQDGLHRIYNNSCLNTLPKSTKTPRREGSLSRRVSECVCESEGVWESKGASQIGEEREGKRKE